LLALLLPPLLLLLHLRPRLVVISVVHLFVILACVHTLRAVDEFARQIAVYIITSDNTATLALASTRVSWCVKPECGESESHGDEISNHLGLLLVQSIRWQEVWLRVDPRREP
jgi:hypothetical protein